MHPLILLLGAAVAGGLAVARPPVELSTAERHARLREALKPPDPHYMELPSYLALDEGHHLPHYDGWLTREIERLNFLVNDEEQDTNYQPMEEVEDPMEDSTLYQILQQRLASIRGYYSEAPKDEGPKDDDPHVVTLPAANQTQEEKKKEFALTPFEKGYYNAGRKPTELPQSQPAARREPPNDVITTPRRTRQNPNLRNTKNFVSSDVEKYKIGLVLEDGHVDHQGHGRNMESAATEDAIDPLLVAAAVAGAIAALTIATVAFAFGWYKTLKEAKAAADVDYPAYGVTGPAADVTGDRKLAQSAHMYHYQHQKQQILAMERSGVEHRDGSVSDPESEEENEEGDYTVYECPGFATTGEMEVKNPMFSDDPTPATPGQCELVKPQPKQ